MLRRTVLPLVAVLALAGCTDKKAAEPAASVAPSASSGITSAPPAATASHDTAAGAMTGLLEAMRAGDSAAVMTWISPVPETDRASITQVERLQSAFGGEGKLFWLVDEREVVGVEEDGEEATVELDGYIVWCTGAGPDDADASCAQPNGTGDEQTTKYDAVQVEGQWYVHLDLNKGQLIDDNPGREGVAA